MNRMRKIGVTGARGFVARGLISHLTSDPDVSLRLFGRDLGQTEEGLPILPLSCSPESLAGLDAIVHLAGLTTSNSPAEMLSEVNVRLAADLFSAATQAGVRRFVFFSSISVHGKGGSEVPLTPGSAIAPVNAYGRSKAEAEMALTEIGRGRSIELVILRPPMIYGPGGGGSLAALHRLVRTGAPIPLGAARAPRSFCSLNNIVSATAATLSATRPPPLLLPADPEDLSTRAIVEIMQKAQGLPVRAPSVPIWPMKALLRAAGQGEAAASLFEPLVIDRRHWMDWGWSPGESAWDAMTTTAVKMAAN